MAIDAKELRSIISSLQHIESQIYTETQHKQRCNSAGFALKDAQKHLAKALDRLEALANPQPPPPAAPGAIMG